MSTSNSSRSRRQGLSDAASAFTHRVTGGNIMPDGSSFLQSSTSPALSVVTPIVPHLNGVNGSIAVPPFVDQRVDVEANDKKEKRRANARRRYLKEKQELAARRKEAARVPSVPYRLPSLLGVDWAARITPESLRLRMKCVISVAWKLGPDASFVSEVKAARDYLAKCRLLPAEINALARHIRDFRSEAETQDGSAKCDWLQAGNGVCARYGTMWQATVTAGAAIEACMSILTEIPIDYRQDGDELLETLAYTGWSVPAHKRARFAERMAQFVAQRIMDEFEFRPV